MFSPLKSTPLMSPTGCAGVGACYAQGDEYAACGVAMPTIRSFLGCGFPLSFEFPLLPGKPSSVCLATEFA